MERTERLLAPTRLASRVRVDPAALATSLFAAVLVLYLALENGGFDAITRSEVGIAVWWVLLVGTAATALPLPWRSRAAIALIALLGAFAIWTALAFLWTESSERTATELARVITYLGILILALAAVGARGERARHLLGGVTFAVGLVVALAVLSRLHPAWFPANTLGIFLPGIEIERRLAYPLGYSSAVGAFAAIAIPLLLAATASARSLITQALAAAALPLAGFALYLTTSGVGLATGVVAIAAFFILAPDRLPKLGTAALGGIGTLILALGLEDRPALDRGLVNAALERQGDELLVIAIAVCAGVTLTQTAVGLAVRFGKRPRWLRIQRRQAWLATGIAVVVAIPIVLAAGLPGEASDRWEAFKGRETTATTEVIEGSAVEAERGSAIIDTSSSGRYQFWEAAVDANSADPLTGIGPGTFEFFWARSPDNFGFVRDAHSLYAESLGELGIVGFVLIAGFVLAVLGIGAVRAIGAAPPARLRIAAATAGAAGFAIAAALDWVWEIAALPAIFILLAAVIATDRDTDPADQIAFSRGRRSSRRRRRRRELAERSAVVALSVAALIVIALPLLGATALRESRIEAASGDLDAALAEAEAAIDAQPYAATPRLQRALVLELRGNQDDAVRAAREATARESTNWRTWITLSRLEARRGNAEEAVRAFRKARELRPARLSQ